MVIFLRGIVTEVITNVMWARQTSAEGEAAAEPEFDSAQPAPEGA